MMDHVTQQMEEAARGSEEAIRQNKKMREAAMKKFPEVFGSAVPNFLQGNAIDDQKMLWGAQMEDQYGRDRQLPWNTPDPGAFGF